ncbi:MAG: hypothetical protein AAGF99_11755 [Bacteroidota bacterium]
MKRLVWIVALVGVVVLGDRFGGLLLERLLLSSEFRYSQLYEGGLDPEVVVLGNSRGVNSFYVPAMETTLDAPSYNLSYNGLSARMLEALFLDYLEHNATPRLLIVEVTALSGDDSQASNFRPYMPLSGRLGALIRADDVRQAGACQAVRLYCYNSELFLRALAYLNADDQNWINRYTISDQIIAGVADLEPQRIRLRPRNLEALQRLVEAAEAEGVTVRLVVGPYLQQYAALLENRAAFVEEIETTTGLRVWDYADAIAEPTAFADRVHLNRQGTDVLLEAMIEDGFFEGL